ncbi:hypothetical protein LCGC14_1769220 [marine sediment metagenome]|uniref:Uncharacterized protein n=1 Tax=marine sediment metagenome TaxID=412755 RepID=A0A0F9JYF6_9ZZZZ
MSKQPVMSAIKSWYRQESKLDDESILGYLLAGFSLGVWMGSIHPEVREKLEDEMANATVAHNELTEELFKEIYK